MEGAILIHERSKKVKVKLYSFMSNGGEDQMKVSDIIEQFLLDLLNEEPDVTLKRNELAQHFSCAPSQINYVISTRFTGQRGYVVESQRGGGGFIRIRRVDCSGGGYLMHVVNSVGDSIDYATVCAMLTNMEQAGIVTKREHRLIASALGDRAIPFQQPQRDEYRAKTFKNMLLSLT